MPSRQVGNENVTFKTMNNDFCIYKPTQVTRSIYISLVIYMHTIPTVEIFIYSVRYLLSSYTVPGTVVGFLNSSVNKPHKKFCPCGSFF